MPSSGEDYGRSLAHKMLSPLAPSSKTSLSTLIQQYCTPFVCFPSAPFLLNQSGWRVCGWGTDCSNVRGQRHRRREPIEQTCVGHHPLIDPPLMVAEVIHLYKHGPWYGVSHALPRGGHLLPWQAETRLYIWSLLAKRESITFLALLLSCSIPLSSSFPFVLYCLSLACSPPILFVFVIQYVVLTSKWQRILILAELSAQSAGIKPGLKSRFVPLRKRGGK